MAMASAVQWPKGHSFMRFALSFSLTYNVSLNTYNSSSSSKYEVLGTL